MFSIIIATHDSERALIPTLAALVPGATAGIVREVIIADGNSRDQTEEVADIAGCRFFASPELTGGRLKAAAAMARGDWLMFLEPGVVPGIGWIDETSAFVERTGAEPRAAHFAGENDLRSMLRRVLGLTQALRNGLIIRKSFYLELGGHGDAAGAEAALQRKIGRRRSVQLRTTITLAGI